MAAPCGERRAAGLPGYGRMAGFVRSLIRSQVVCSRRFDERLPAEYRLDGNREFLDRVVPEYLAAGQAVCDVGGGKNPVVGPARKRQLGLRITGLDIDSTELAAAPEGVYDEAIAADISRYRGRASADLVICQALLEHVRDVDGALCGIASILKPGGRALLFVPSRNAVFARLNLVLPQRLKRRLLFAVFPEMGRDHGFPAYYRKCTPRGLARMSAHHGLVCERQILYYHSEYFRCCFALHALWRLWVMVFRSLAGPEAAETFTCVLRKSAAEAGE
jgi:SAM-dependent methyltransferase